MGGGAAEHHLPGARYRHLRPDATRIGVHHRDRESQRPRTATDASPAPHAEDGCRLEQSLLIQQPYGNDGRGTGDTRTTAARRQATQARLWPRHDRQALPTGRNSYDDALCR